MTDQMTFQATVGLQLSYQPHTDREFDTLVIRRLLLVALTTRSSTNI